MYRCSPPCIESGSGTDIVFVQRIGNTRRYRVSLLGLKLGTLLVKLRTRLLGPLCSLATDSPRQRSNHPAQVEAAIRQVDAALNNLCQTLGFKVA